jgi:hypothetical protein
MVCGAIDDRAAACTANSWTADMTEWRCAP